MCCVYNEQAKIKSLGVQLDHNLVWTDHMFEVWSHHCLVSAMPRFRKTGILMVAVWTSLESRKAQRLHIRTTKKIKKHFESFCTSCWLAWITCLRPKRRPNWFLTEKNQKYWTILEKFIKYIPRAKTVLVYWYWIPKPTTTFPASLGITPNWSPTWKQNRSLSQFAVCCHYRTLLLFLHWTTSLSSWWPARSTPPSSNSAASSLGGR